MNDESAQVPWSWSERYEELRAENEQLRARIDAYEGDLQKWEEMGELIRRSSLGAPEAKALREQTPPGLAQAIARASEYLVRAELAEAQVGELSVALDEAIEQIKWIGGSFKERAEKAEAEITRLRAVVREFDAAWSEWVESVKRGEAVSNPLPQVPTDEAARRRAAAIAGILQAARALDVSGEGPTDG